MHVGTCICSWYNVIIVLVYDCRAESSDPGTYQLCTCLRSIWRAAAMTSFSSVVGKGLSPKAFSSSIRWLLDTRFLFFLSGNCKTILLLWWLLFRSGRLYLPLRLLWKSRIEEESQKLLLEASLPALFWKDVGWGSWGRKGSTEGAKEGRGSSVSDRDARDASLFSGAWKLCSDIYG